MRAGSILKYPLRAVEGVSLAALRTLLTRGPGTARKVIGETLRAATPPDRLHVARAWDLVRGFACEGEVRLGLDGWYDGATAPLERFIMAQLVRFFRPGLLLEVGTYRGSTTRLLLDHAPLGSRVYTVDLPPGTDPSEVTGSTEGHLIRNRQLGIEYKRHARAADVVQVLGSTFDAGTWDKLPSDFDFVFVDASHSYDAVRNDSERALRKLARDGIMLWHDYIEGESEDNGVGRFIRELMVIHTDVLRCEDTQLAIKIPVHHLWEAESRISAFFPDGDYNSRCPEGPFPWLGSDYAKYQLAGGAGRQPRRSLDAEGSG